MSDPDIVTRLRGHIAITTRLHYAKDGYPEPVYVHGPSPICQEAADEIERLRAERDEARRELDRLGPLLLHAASEIKKVCAERDEARREVCNLSIHPPRDYALERGWFCFKEEP